MLALPWRTLEAHASNFDPLHSPAFARGLARFNQTLDVTLRRPILLLVSPAFLPLVALASLLGIRSLDQERAAIERGALDGVRRLSTAITRDLIAQTDLVRIITRWRELDPPLDQAG